MENSSTVRIDMQRLQMLNDRLCQTLEALNQVRLTAHNFVPPTHMNTGMGFNPGYQMGYMPQPTFWGAQGFNGYPTHPGYAPMHNPMATHGYMPNQFSSWGAPNGYMTQPYFTGTPQAFHGGFEQTRPAHFAPQQPIW